MRLSCVKILNPVRNNVPLMILPLCECAYLCAHVWVCLTNALFNFFWVFRLRQQFAAKVAHWTSCTRNDTKDTQCDKELVFNLLIIIVVVFVSLYVSISVSPLCLISTCIFFLLAAQQWMQELMRKKKKTRNRNENRSASLERSCLLSYRNKEI